MNAFRLITVFLITLYFSNCTSEKNHNTSIEFNKEELLIALEKFNQAFKEGNTDVLESMITNDYIHTNGNSKSIGKNDWLSYLRKREKDIKAGRIEVTDYQLEDLEIKYHNHTAIVTGKVLVSSKKENEVQENEYRVTNIWVNQSGQWKRAGFHDGKIK